MRCLSIGDLHIQPDNLSEVTIFIQKLGQWLEKNPVDLIVILGDTLHTHETVYTVCLNKMLEYIQMCERYAPTFILVGNHDFCFGEKTMVRMSNGTLKNVKEIISGDQLLGDDGTPRSVLEVFKGHSTILGVRGTAFSYEVTKDHLIPVRKSLDDPVELVPAFMLEMRKYYDVRVPVPCVVPPYLYGKWFASYDMHYPAERIQTRDLEVVIQWDAWCAENTGTRVRYLGNDYYSLDADTPHDIPDAFTINSPYCNHHSNLWRGTGVPPEHKEQARFASDPEKMKLLLDHKKKKFPTREKKFPMLVTLLGSYLESSVQDQFEFIRGLIQIDRIVLSKHKLGEVFEVISNVLINWLTQYEQEFTVSNHGNVMYIFIEELKPFTPHLKVLHSREDVYIGFRLDGNAQFQLGDRTIAHNCHNQAFLNDQHPFVGWKKSHQIIDRVTVETIQGKKLVFCPYVPDGRFLEALSTVGDEWKTADCIFAHQLLDGAKMGPILAKGVEKWDESFPQVISGHIHDKQQPQPNLRYTGSAMQVSFGERDDHTLALLTFGDTLTVEEIDIAPPRKKTIHLDNVTDVKELKLPTDQDTRVKLSIHGDPEEFKTFKKTEKYKQLIEKGIKVVFKQKKSTPVNLPETTQKTFPDILYGLIQQDPKMIEIYNSVLGQREVEIVFE